MTETPGYDPWAGPLGAPKTAEARARGVVKVLAVLACAAGIATFVLLMVVADWGTQTWWTGWYLGIAATVVGVACLWHGKRNAHERGRWFAVVAVVVALPIWLLGTWSLVMENCPGRPASRCNVVDRDL